VIAYLGSAYKLCVKLMTLLMQQCPHSSYPLSQGIPFDIEDFGIALSAGLTCPKHGWSFDLFSGRADRGTYRLKVWEVELREVPGAEGDEKEDREVWIRRKPRIG
jgi:nitrite reductase/ring-hydroxylating ferredoxin subunit